MKKYYVWLPAILLIFFCGLLMILSDLPGKVDDREKVIYLTTMGRVSKRQAALAEQEIEQFYGINVMHLGARALPENAYCTVRNRYVAVKLLHDLQKQDIADRSRYNYKVLALTDQDIETEKGKHWGVMGLAFLGGDECVVSTFRLNGSNDRLSKVVLHETGHMLGISHCTSGIASCFMVDAKGKGATVDRARKYLCDQCRTKLKF